MSLRLNINWHILLIQYMKERAFIMLIEFISRDYQDVNITEIEPSKIILDENTDTRALEQANIRRLMYERIAQGHALNEAEEKADHKWNKG